MPDINKHADIPPVEEPIKDENWIHAVFSVFIRCFKTKEGAIGLIVSLFLLVVAIFSTHLAPADPFAPSTTAVLQAPSSLHWLGTDDLGRDELSRIIYGARVSMIVGLGSVAVATIAGVFIGLVTGYFGGWMDSIVTRTMDIMMAFPGLVLALIISALMGISLTNTIIALGIVSVPRFARLIRGQVMTVMQRDFIESARAVHAGHIRIMTKYVFPHLVPLIVIEATLTIAFSILTEASLSFLGLGVQPPHTSWGQMLKTGYPYLETAPWIAFAPATITLVAVLGFNLLGDGLRTVLQSNKN
ncbi:ABC transporter permease [Candidatus Formimonas warabiya]|uniref:ABC transporter permease n=1 Tax=Formimonas warabiya TaxID=1761012 RepID=UPI001BE4B2A0|nr:ABC transporter permease [Candidatus Formimonas warabiya]